MGYGYNVDEDSIVAMTTTATALEEAVNNMKQCVASIEGDLDDNSGGLGAHEADIRELIEELKGLLDEGNKKMLILMLKLTKAAAIRKAHLEENRYTSGGRSR